jgi:deazaflavin-dependent oxidoreductase (nitroreductase family)
MTPEEMKAWNEQIKAEFRANAGVVGGPFEGKPMLILHTTGRKTGNEVETPLVYLPDGDRVVVFASAGGSHEHPAWYLNLKAQPAVTVELGTETVAMTATELDRGERDAAYARQVAEMPQFADYQEGNPRVIPAVALTRA